MRLLFILAVALLLSLIYLFHDSEGSLLPHINTMRQIKADCQRLELVGIARDGYLVKIYDCGGNNGQSPFDRSL